MLNATDVVLRETKLLEFSLNTPDLEELGVGVESQLQLNTEFNVLHGVSGERSVRCKIFLHPVEGKYYTISMTMIGAFEFLVDAEDDEKEEYLKTMGSQRVYDNLRSIVSVMTAPGIFGAVQLPPINPAINFEQ